MKRAIYINGKGKPKAIKIYKTADRENSIGPVAQPGWSVRLITKVFRKVGRDRKVVGSNPTGPIGTPSFPP